MLASAFLYFGPKKTGVWKGHALLMCVYHRHVICYSALRSFKGMIIQYAGEAVEENGVRVMGHKIHYDDDEVRWHVLRGRNYKLFQRCARPTIRPEALRRANEGSKEDARYAPRPAANTRSKVSMYLIDNVEFFLNKCGGFDALASLFGSQATPAPAADNAPTDTGDDTSDSNDQVAATTVDSGNDEPVKKLMFDTYKVMVSIAEKCARFLSEKDAKPLVEPLQAGVVQHFRSLSNEDVKSLSSEHLSDLMYSVRNLLRCTRPPAEALHSTLEMQMTFELRRLSSPQIRKRLDALITISSLATGKSKLVTTEISTQVEAFLRDNSRNMDVRQKQENIDRLRTEVNASVSSFLDSWMHKEKVVQQLFGDSVHDQVIRNCGDLFTTMAKRDQLTNEDIQAMWASTIGAHEAIARATYNVLLGLATNLTLEKQQYVLQLVESSGGTETAFRGWTELVIDFIHDFAVAVSANESKGKERGKPPKRGSSPVTINRTAIDDTIALIWKFVQDRPAPKGGSPTSSPGRLVSTPTTLLYDAVEALVNLVLTPGPSMHDRQVMLIVWSQENLAATRSASQSLLILRKILESLPIRKGKKPAKRAQDSRSLNCTDANTVLYYLHDSAGNDGLGLLDVFFTNLASFATKLRAYAKKKATGKALASRPRALRCNDVVDPASNSLTLMQHIEEHMNFLGYVMTNWAPASVNAQASSKNKKNKRAAVSTNMTPEHLHCLWTSLLGDDSAPTILPTSAQEHVLQWLQQYHHLLSLDVQRAVFERITAWIRARLDAPASSPGGSISPGIPPVAVSVFRSYFVAINLRTKNLRVVSKKSKNKRKQTESEANTVVNYASLVRCSTSVEGLESFWAVVLGTDEEEDAATAGCTSLDLLVQLHCRLELSKDPESRLNSDVQEKFLSRCLSTIADSCNDPAHTLSLSRAVQLLQKCLLRVSASDLRKTKTLPEDSYAQVIPNCNKVANGNIILNIQIAELHTGANEGNPAGPKQTAFTLSVSPHTTFRQILARVWGHLPRRMLPEHHRQYDVNKINRLAFDPQAVTALLRYMVVYNTTFASLLLCHGEAALDTMTVLSLGLMSNSLLLFRAPLLAPVLPAARLDLCMQYHGNPQLIKMLLQTQLGIYTATPFPSPLLNLPDSPADTPKPYLGVDESNYIGASSPSDAFLLSKCDEEWLLNSLPCYQCDTSLSLIGKRFQCRQTRYSLCETGASPNHVETLLLSQSGDNLGKLLRELRSKQHSAFVAKSAKALQQDQAALHAADDVGSTSGASSIFRTSDDKFHKQLFQLLGKDLSSSIAERVWHILMLLPTSPGEYNALYSLQLGKKEQWPLLFPVGIKNVYKLLYSLQIVDSFLYPFYDFGLTADQKPISTDAAALMPTAIEEGDRYHQWCKNFVEYRGVQYLITIVAQCSQAMLRSSPRAPLCAGLLLKISLHFLLMDTNFYDERQQQEQQRSYAKKGTTTASIDMSELVGKVMDILHGFQNIRRENAAAGLEDSEGSGAILMRFGMRILAGCVMTSSACLSQLCVRPDLVDWLRAVLVVQPNPCSRMESAAAIYRICRHYREEEVALTTTEAVASYVGALGTADGRDSPAAAGGPVNVDVCDFFLAIIFADFKLVCVPLMRALVCLPGDYPPCISCVIHKSPRAHGLL